ncbi:MAG TPA: tetratricopeptide repeat protein [Gammaproteobacteria bacterium]|nr:tetratricopeptide repeat protein [Gammaproteobacteria bacterium]
MLRIAIASAAFAVALAGCSATSTDDDGLRGDSSADQSPTIAGPASEPTQLSQEVLYKLLLAEIAGRRGEVSLALDNYLEVAEETRDPGAAERAVSIAVFARDEERGIKAARLWTEVSPNNLDARRVYGALLMRAGREDQAVDELNHIVAPPNDTADRFALIGDMLARERDQDSAARVMERIAGRHPNNIDATFALAQFLGRSGKFERSLELLDQLLLVQPGHEQALIYQARILQREGKTTEALSAMSRYLEQRPDSQEVRMTYARLLVDAKRYEEARQQFELLSERNPEDGDVAYALGLLLLQTNRYDEAAVQFERLVALNERVDAALYYLGQIAESKNDPVAALGAYGRVDRGDHYLNAQIRIGVVLAEEGEIEKARAQLHGIRVSNQQEAVRVYRSEADILARADRLRDAMGVYDTALDEYPGNSDLLYARAMLAEKLDMIEVLERDLREILSREPNNADALNALGYTLADRTNRYEEALELIKQAYELRPDDHYIVDSMGWIMYRLGRYEEALKFLRRAMELNNDPEVAAHLGEVLWVMGDKAAARKIWNTALESTPDDERLLDVIKRFGN